MLPVSDAFASAGEGHWPAQRPRRMKAATQVFERVLLFGIGVIIFIACYAVFNNYQSYFLGVSMEDQVDEIGSYIATGILKVAEKGNQTEASISLKIPPRAGNEPYIVRLSSAGLNISTTVTGYSRFFRLYGLNKTFVMTGESVVSTTVSELLIYKKGNRIILL